MNDTPKLPVKSVTVWGGISAIFGGLSGIALVISGTATSETMVPALTSLAGGIMAIVGRLRATQPIER